MKHTGNGIDGPGSDLWVVELEGGVEGVAIAFPDGEHPELRALDAARKFLVSPGVDGLLPLIEQPAPGVFVYDLKGGLTVRELLAAHERLGRPCGERAGLELLLQAAEVLADAADRADAAGLPGHGDISPWRLVVDGEGYADLLGYGLPPVALLDFLQERADSVSADALRYAPPERLELQGEGPLGDIFSLALVAVELVAGRPVFDGSADEVLEALLAGEAPARIERLCPGLPDPTLDLLCICCELDPARRYPDVEEVIRVVKRCLRDAEGPSLKGALDAARGVEVRRPLGPAPAGATTQPARPAAAAAPSPVAAKPAPPPVDADPLGPPPPLPALAAGASLDQVRARAKAVVARVQELHRRAGEVLRVAKEESAGAPPDVAALVRRLQDAVAKGEKAVSAAQRSVGLVELDEDASEALVTLGLVTGAEQQGQAAGEAARELLDEIRAGMVSVKQTRERIAELAKKAQASANTAAKALAEADDLITELERGLSSGELSAPGVEPAADVARKAIVRARGAGAKANDAVAQARGASSVVDSEAYAASAAAAADAVKKALVEIASSLEKVRKAEASGLEAVRADVVAQSSVATEAAGTARKALDRARAAVEQGPDEEARGLVKRAGPLADKATTAADQARAAAAQATAATHSAAAREVLVPARRAAHEAVDASDQVQALCKRAIALAGAAAQAAEALATARESASKLRAKAEAAVAHAIVQVESLVHDTDEVHGGAAVAERERAVKALSEARDRLSALHARGERFASIDDPDDAEADLKRLKSEATAVHNAATEAEAACKRCRELADDEIREILAERRRLGSLQRYAATAREHADRCRKAVDDAWLRYRGLPQAIQRSDIREVRALLKQAFDAIDIAEFQAGEAGAAADHAARQGDPAEASGYAESAASFWERISEDLPEALRAIDEAEGIATAEIRALDEARARTTAAAEQAVAARDTIRAAGRSSVELADGWAKVKSIAVALEQIRKADTGLDDAVAEAEYARDRAASSDKAADATEMIPVGEAVASRLAKLRSTAETALAELKKAVQAARAERDEVEALRAEIATLNTDVVDALKKVKACQERLDKVLAEHGATGSEATGWQEALEECHKKVRIGRKRLKEAIETLKPDSPVKEARTLADRCRKARAQALEQIGPAAEAEQSGIKAAHAEAKSRAEAEDRRKTEAREAAAHDANRADSSLNAVVAALAELEGPVRDAGSREASTLFEDVQSLVGRIRELAGAAARARDAAEGAAAADAVLTASLDAREAAQRATATSREALAKLAEARTLALAAAEQAAALKDLRAQMAELASQADAAVRLAREQSGFLDEVLDRARTDATRALRGEADEALASARKAATKVHTAAPMLAEAESLDVAMHMLKAARRAVDAANDAASQVPRLVAEAEKRLILEAEDARKALEAAREAARAPLATAEAAVDKARGWLDQAQPALADHADDAEVTSAFGDVSATFATVEALHRAAEAATGPLAAASTAAQAEQVGAKIQAAVDQVLVACREVREARDAFDAAVAGVVAARERLAAAKSEADAARGALEDRLAGARASATELEAEVEAARLDPVEASDVLDHVDDALADANEAVRKALVAFGPVSDAADGAALDLALEAAAAPRELAAIRLGAFDKAIADARDEVGRMRREIEERRQQEERAAKDRAAAERDDRARAERDAVRSARPGLRPGLRPAGPPRGDLPARTSGEGRSGDDAARAGRLRPPGGLDRRAREPAASGPSDRLRPPGRLSRSGESPPAAEDREPRASAAGPVDRRLRRPSQGDDGPPPTEERRSLRRSAEGGLPDRRLRRPGGEPVAGPGDAAGGPADRRLRRPGGEPAEPVGGSSVDRRLRRPGESSADSAEPAADRRLRRPGAAADDAPADRRLRRPGDDAPVGRSLSRSAERPGLRPPLRPSRDASGEQDLPPAGRPPLRGSRDAVNDAAAEAEGSDDRDDLRSRLRERRASRMASGAGGADERPVRPAPGAPAGRPPLRGPGLVTRSTEADDDEPAESGADLLRRRVQDRSTGRSPVPLEEASTRPRRSIDDLRSRMRIKPGDED